MSRRSYPQLPIALVVLVLGTFVAVPTVMAEDEVCEGFPEKTQRIGRLGGPQAFSKTTANTPAELLQQLEANKEVIGSLLGDRGLGNLTDDLISAVRSGKLSERPLERGEVFKWMAWRKRSGPVTSGPLCLVAKKTYEAYEIQVEEETGMKAAKAVCSLRADNDGEKMSVDASGSSPGVEVTMSGPGGTKKVISGGSTSWEGMAEAPGDYTFTAKAEAQGTKTVTTHTFVIPKICVNLAYSGQTTADQPGDTDTCTETARITVAAAPPPPTPPVVPPMDVDTDTTSSMDGRWTFRGFLASLATDDDMIMTNVLRSNGVSERTKLRFDGGQGLGAGLEYHFNDRVGLEGGLLWADLDSSFILDLDNDWERDTDGSSLLVLTVGPNFHLTPGRKVDFYIGPFLGYSDVGDATYQALGETIRRDFGDDFMFGAQIGLDISFGDGPAGLHLGGRYLDLAAAQDIGIDPLIGEVGFFYHF